MNPNCALKVREDLDELLDVGFIYPMEITQWLFPLVIVPKKNGKLWICVDYWNRMHKAKGSIPFTFFGFNLKFSGLT